MLRLCCVILVFLVVPALAAEPKDSVVRVIVKDHDKVLVTKSGLVVSGGFVLTTCGKHDSITAVEVVVAGHEPRPADGVVAYNAPDNLMLMRIDWQGQSPPATTFADVAPAKGDSVSLVQFGRSSEEFEVAQDAGKARFAFGDPMNEPSLGGAPLLRNGVVVGLVTGAHAVMSPTQGVSPGTREDPTGMLAARVELLKALTPGEVILWSEWNKRMASIKRADTLYEERANDLKNPGGEDELVKRLKRVVELDSFHRTAWTDLAICHARARRTEEAIAATTHALALCPTDHEALLVRSAAMQLKGEWVDAISAAKDAVRLRPDLVGNHAMLGGAYLGNRLYDEAVAEFKEAVRLDPNSASAADGLKRAQEQKDRAGGK